MDKDLKNLKVGDKVMISSSGYSNPGTIKIIERFTKTQIMIKGSSDKYSRDSGRLIGSSGWTTAWLNVASEEKIKAIELDEDKRRCVYYLKDIDWNKIDLDFLKGLVITLEKG